MGKYREHIAKTISKYRKALGIKQIELAKQLGVAPSSISAWENNSNAPDIEILAKLCDIFDISLDEMYGTNGNNVTELIDAHELQHIEKYRTLDAYGKKAVDSVLNIEYERCTASADTPEPKVIKVVPLANFSLSAGTGNELLDNNYEMIEIDGNKYRNADIAFRVKGDSMEPKYHDGDLVYIQKQSDIEIGEIGAFLYNGKQYLKKLILEDGIYKLHSLNNLNNNHPDVVIENNSLIIYGKVIN